MSKFSYVWLFLNLLFILINLDKALFAEQFSTGIIKYIFKKVNIQLYKEIPLGITSKYSVFLNVSA